jgi:hypothetical protein
MVIRILLLIPDGVDFAQPDAASPAAWANKFEDAIVCIARVSIDVFH